MEESTNTDKDESKNSAPDGGWGWVVVFAAFVVYVIADGCTFSFGVFYTELVEYFQQSKGKTAIIVGLLYGFPLLISPFICALVTSFGSRIIGRLGGLLTGVAFLISVFATSVEFLFFTIGFIGSIGLAMCYLSAIVAVSFYFDKRRGLATGMAVCGSGIGTLIFAPLIDAMLVAYTWRGSLLLISGICFNMLITGAAFIPISQRLNDEKDSNSLLPPSGKELFPKVYDIRYRSHCFLPKLTKDVRKPKLDVRRRASIRLNAQSINDPITESCPELSNKTHRSLDKTDQSSRIVDLSDQSNSAAKIQDSANRSKFKSFFVNLREIFVSMLDPTLPRNWRYLTFCVSNFLLCLWFGIPYVYITDQANLLSISKQKGSLLVSIIGISSMIGQICLGFLSDKCGRPIVIYSIAMCICGGATCFIPVCLKYWMLCLSMTLFGFFIGANYALATLIVIELVGLEKMPIAFGWLQLGQGIATLIGTPLAGLMYDLTGEYSLSFSIAGAWIILSGVILWPMLIKDCFSSRDEVKQDAVQYGEVPLSDV